MANQKNIELLEELLKHATDVIDNLTYESNGKYYSGIKADTDVTQDVKFVIDKTNEYFERKEIGPAHEKPGCVVCGWSRAFSGRCPNCGCDI